MRQLTDPAALRNLFAVHKISQRQAAAACNVSPATINILLRKGLPPKTDWTGLKNALISLLAGAVLTVIMGLANGYWPGALFTGVTTGILCFAALQISSSIVRKRRKELDNPKDEEQ